jgi:CheY-like chemotaxis protein
MAPASVAASSVVVRPSRNILVVDDNVDAAESLALLLRMDGHEVRVTHDGPAALVAAQADPPDLAQQLRQRPGLKHVLLVAMTGWGQEEDRRRSQQAGFDDHLVKPVEPKALHRLLAHPRSRSSPPAS